MRLIGTLQHENEAQKLSQFLKSQNIANSCEISFDPTYGSMSYQIWVHDEDKIAQATEIFEQFYKNPTDPRYDVPIIKEPEPELARDEEEEEIPVTPRRFKTYVTSFFLALCAFVFFLDTLQEIRLRKEGFSETTFLMTPLEMTLMFDLPPALDKLGKVIEKNELEGKKYDGIPPQLKMELESADKAPFWRGIYDWVVFKIKGENTALAEGPLFSRIRQGEVWRLFTPCILHRDLLHILFNMLWLWYLGRPIEQRIGLMRTLVLTLIAGVGTNMLQYFMSGPLFIGYSGIITALAGFIWMRERIAPWEGYPLNKATIWFLVFFLVAIFGLQVVSFFIQIFTSHNFAPQIANTAHIAGAVIGALLARYSFFAQRVPK